MPFAPAAAPLPLPQHRWPVPPLVGASVGLHALALGGLALAPGSWGLPAVGAMLANHVLLGAVGMWPRSTGLGPNLSRLPAAAQARGAVAITIDDGPDPAVTPAVLDLLAQLQVQATFFCIAERARAQPELTRRIVAMGHDVQNHTNRHPHHFAMMGTATIERELRAAQDTLADITGVRPHCFRAPAGLRNPMLDPVLHRLGLTLVSWTRRGYDTRTDQADSVLQRLGQGLAAGDILLLHDGNARRTARGNPVLMEVLPGLVERIRHAGLHADTLAASVPMRHTAGAPTALAA